MRIAIGSTNPVKEQAARAVLMPLYPAAEFVTVTAPSGVSAQPWGDQETRLGARNRAQFALERTQAALAIGLEGGVTESEFGLMTSAWCVIMDDQQHLGVGGNSCTLLPQIVVDYIRQGYELGAAMDQLIQQHDTKHKNGAIGILTNDLETRQSAYETIIRFALAPFRHPEWY
ncbi:MAG: inosine/xanthosine triphosphatase [Anaerolineae bacterium]|nr:inosine/xanthosine triphosphatase [Anaerolineae bacterium]